MKNFVLRLTAVLTFTAITICLSNLTFGQQVADPNFQPKVTHPTFTKKYPKVLFDEAHYNFHTAGGRYKPFAQLIAADGYQITSNKEKLSKALLKGYDILVIANALGEERGLSAFTDDECDAVLNWVQAGGSLLLIADHTPFGAAAKVLAMRFGVEMSTAYTGDRTNFDKAVPGEFGQLVFTRENNLLAEHAVTKGRNGTERINRVITFTGQSLSIPKDGLAFLKLSDTAFDVIPPDGKEMSAANRAQGVALKLKKGRVIILGEAAMLTAQLSAKGQKPMGMNYPNTDNQQLALNIMHWLSRKL
ncbi:MAG: DUF4350 domain-containing protein [Pyrinomonadaceae bacterium]